MYTMINLCNSVLSFGGSFQNPFLIGMNYMSPTAWKSFSYYSVVSYGIYSTAAGMLLASVGKLVAVFTLYLFGNQVVIDTDKMASIIL